jgi:hypothetical protein
MNIETRMLRATQTSPPAAKSDLGQPARRKGCSRKRMTRTSWASQTPTVIALEAGGKPFTPLGARMKIVDAELDRTLTMDDAVAASPKFASLGRDAAKKWIEILRPSIHEIKYVGSLQWVSESLPKGLAAFLPKSMTMNQTVGFCTAFSCYCDEVVASPPCT